MNNKLATLILVLITAAWGSSFILMKNVATDVSALAFLTLRFGLAGLILAAIFCKHVKRYTKRTILHSFVLGGLLCGYMVLQICGLRYTSASNSGFITSLSVLVVPLLSGPFLKKKPTKSNYLGVLLAVLGLACITGILQDFTALNRGDFYTLLCAVCVAVHIIVADFYVKEDDGLLLGIGQTLAAAVLSFVCWFFTDSKTFASVDYTGTLVAAVVLTAVFCTAFAFTGQVVMQKFVAPSRIAVIFTLEPVFAYIYALFIPGPEGVTEPLTLFKLLGSVFIVGGMIISEIGLLERFKKENISQTDTLQ
ncbi:MAG: DMT family transporter [Clostridia bacterium]|nr:DMT family transporter [Clostridia bacterium]